MLIYFDLGLLHHVLVNLIFVDLPFPNLNSLPSYFLERALPFPGSLPISILPDVSQILSTFTLSRC